MTPDDIDQAIKANGLGWDPLGSIVIAAQADGDRCNAYGCMGYAQTANEIGLTATEFMPALIALVGDPLAEPPVPIDRAPLRAHQATQRAFRSELATRALGWDCTTGTIHVWDTSDREGTLTAPQWNGAQVTTQTYRAQAGIAGATMADMADALADLVAGDSTAFDLIMSA